MIKFFKYLANSRIVKKSSLFDRKYYMMTYDDVRLADIDPLRHFNKWGWTEGRNPNPDFDVMWYLNQNTDIKKLDINPLVHYIKFGQSEGRSRNESEFKVIKDYEVIQSSGLFDKDYYLAENPDVKSIGIDPLLHFVRFGWKEERKPNTEFDVKWYLDQYGDVKKEGINPLIHFIIFGKKELRTIKSLDHNVLNKVRNKKNRNGYYNNLNDNNNFVENFISFDNQKLVKVSVICAVFNHEKFLRKVLEGFVRQKTDFSFEVIIGDDASTDNSKFIIEEYISKYPDLFNAILRDENIGPRNNLMDLTTRIRGKYVALCEGDDYWIDPYKLQIQVDFLDNNLDYSICFHNVYIFQNDLTFVKIFPNIQEDSVTLDNLVKDNFIQTNSVMYRWAFPDGLTTTNFNCNAMPGDWYIHILHACKGNIKLIDRVMSVYNIHSGGIWGSFHGKPAMLHKKYGIQEIELFRTFKKILPVRFEEILNNKQLGIFTVLAKEYITTNSYSDLLQLIKSNDDIANEGMLKLGYKIKNKIINNIIDLKEILVESVLVSVVITSYNHENYIEKAIQSVLMQEGNYKLEIIIGDDCSTDKTPIIIKNYQRKYPNIIKVLPNIHNIGMQQNLLRCFNECKGDYIAICEGDDYWLSKLKIGKQIEFLNSNKECYMCFNWLLLYYEDNDKFIPHSGQSGLKNNKISFNYLLNNPITANFSACLYKRDAIDLVDKKYFSLENVADWLFNLAIAKHGEIGFIKEIMSVYRIHKGGQWSGLSKKDVMKRTKNAKLLNSEFVNNGIFLSNFQGRWIEQQKIKLSRNFSNNKINYNIDSIQCIGDILNIRGWFLLITSNKATVDASGIVFINIKTNKVVKAKYFEYLERPDLMEKYKESFDSVPWCGFVGDIKISLPNNCDEYILGIFSNELDGFIIINYEIKRRLNSWELIKT